jgi:hypothetical protein
MRAIDRDRSGHGLLGFAVTSSVAMLYVVLAATPAHAAWDDLEGKKVSQAQDALEDHGYRRVHRDGDRQYWWNEDRDRCVRLDVDGKRVDDLRRVDAADCKRGKHKNDEDDDGESTGNWNIDRFLERDED